MDLLLHVRDPAAELVLRLLLGDRRARDEPDVVVAAHESDFASGDLVGEGCVFDGVKVVDFDGVELEAGDFAGGC